MSIYKESASGGAVPLTLVVDQEFCGGYEPLSSRHGSLSIATASRNEIRSYLVLSIRQVR